MPIAHGAEQPAALLLAGEALGIQHAVDGAVEGVQTGILGMDEVDGVAQTANGRHRVDPLPEQVAGIEVRTDEGAYGLAQPKQRFGVVDAEARVHFQRDFSTPCAAAKAAAPRQ